MTRTFEENLSRLGMKPKKIQFNVTEDVYNELETMAKNNDMTLSDFMREFVDYYILELNPQ